ncbi:B-cell receptor CD22-like [Halichoeres trimaculatus]|uniref:B-cell receptor CD22-like n=1 Tax=Halichoeres trimaculatus TaxID=147232 RepID=UPI003D9DD6E4
MLAVKQVARGQTDWGVTYSSHQICASKGSTVDIPCTYTYPPRIDELDTKVEETLWFTNLNGNQSVDLRSDPDYSGRVEYLFEQNDCTLRIKDLRETDSAEYKFRFTTNQQDPPKPPSVSVSPTSEIVEGMTMLLTCRSDANPAATYTWHKKNRYPGHQPLTTITQPYFKSIKASDSGEYYCLVENKLGRRSSESIFIDVLYAPKLSPVTVNPSGEIVEDSSVTLTCSSDANPAAIYAWYKKTEYPDLQPLEIGSQLIFESIQSTDSGHYYCETENKLGRRRSEYVSVNVTYPPKPPSVSLSPSGEIVEGSSLNLTCSSDANPAANFTWYKKTEYPDLQPLEKGSQLLFESIQSSESGDYYCEAENKLGRRISEDLFVDVKYPPKPPSVSVSPSGVIVEGSSVTLTCSSDANPAANYTWFKKDEDSPKASGEIFTLDYTRPEHSGDYICVAQNVLGHRSFAVHVTVVEGKFNTLFHEL